MLLGGRLTWGTWTHKRHVGCSHGVTHTVAKTSFTHLGQDSEARDPPRGRRWPEGREVERGQSGSRPVCVHHRSWWDCLFGGSHVSLDKQEETPEHLLGAGPWELRADSRLYWLPRRVCYSPSSDSPREQKTLPSTMWLRLSHILGLLFYSQQEAPGRWFVRWDPRHTLRRALARVSAGSAPSRDGQPRPRDALPAAPRRDLLGGRRCSDLHHLPYFSPG